MAMAGASLPNLPDLGAASSSRGAIPAQSDDTGDSQAFSAFSTDTFKLDSAPPSRARSSQSMGAIPSQDDADDPFFDEDEAFSTGSTAGSMAMPAMPAESMAAALPMADAEEVEDDHDDFAVGGTEYGEVDLGGGGAPDSEGFDEADDFGEASAAGGTVDLTDSAVSDSDFPEGDDAEFGAIPQEEDDGPPSVGFDASDVGPASRVAAAVEKINPADVARPERKKKRVSRKGRIALAAVLMLAVAGGALSLVPAIGPFGMHLVMDMVNREKYQALLNQTAEKVLALRQRDDYTLAREIVALCKQAQAQAPRYTPLTAYAAFAHYSWVARYPGETDMQANGKVLLAGLLDDGADESVKYLEQAQAAQALVGEDYAGAARALQRLGDSVEVLALRGELALRQGNLEEAKTAWSSAAEKAPSAWTLYGLTRAVFKLGDAKAAEKYAAQALEKSPNHVGTKLVLAELEFRAANEAKALEWIDKVLEQPQLLSPQEVIDAHSLLGEIHLDRGRISKAEGEFSLALKVDPKALRPLLGLARTFSTAGRHAAALARYAAAAADPLAPMEAQLGVVRSHIELERNDKAKKALIPLKKEHPDHPEVSYWFGRLVEGSGKNEAAEKAYRVAIEKGGNSEIAVAATVALAKLMTKVGKLDEAEKLLSDAQEKFPKSVLLRNSLGQVALSQGRYEVALEAFEAAQKLDPGDVTALFNKGSALRRLRRHEEAWKVFEEVAKLDKDLPGLPLERGLLLEQSGRGDEALAEFEKALAKDPNDPDLKLRVGCGRVAAGEGDKAAPILEEVVKKRSRSSEALHCLGRALFLQGKKLLAIKRLEQAIELDPTRAEYHMYRGWVANEAGQVAVAKEALNLALKLDKGLGDAYWQRGRLSLSQGGPGDAIFDLKKALKLRPSRYEAHADLAQALYQMGRRQEALKQWPLALKEEPDNPVWLYRYGKLLRAEHREGEAARQLRKAISLVEKEETPPAWLWEAHHLAAACMPPGHAANEHWKKFLELGPPDSPYRKDALKALHDAGEVWQPRRP
jgi:tetratricopeptide (TPR) repeat protein